MERPILFSTPMVQAILQGRKTQTRRIVKPQPQEIYFMKNAPLDYHNYTREPWKPWKVDLEDGNSSSRLCPYGESGDRLWVRETWLKQDGVYKFLADNEDWRGIFKFKPSIHMPKAAARIWLQVESVGVERLQDISEVDALAEGIKVGLTDGVIRWYHDYLRPNGYPLENDYDESPESPYTAKGSYATLWERINGPGSWGQNPWVWVIKFKKTS